MTLSALLAADARLGCHRNAVYVSGLARAGVADGR